MTSLLQRFTLAARIWSIIGLAVLALTANTFFTYNDMYSAILHGRKQSVDFMLQASTTILNHYAKQEKSGAMSKEQAQKAAVDALAQLRFDDGNYIFVYLKDGTLVANPTATPDKIGTNLIGVKDSNGVEVIKELINRSLNAPRGELEYLWPRVKGGEPLPKLGISAHFADWQWMYGSGIYIDDLNAQVIGQIKLNLIESAVIILALVLIGGVVVSSIRQPVQQAVKAMQELAEGDGDLSKKLPVEGNHELAQLAQAFNKFAGGIGQVISDISQISAQLGVSSAKLRDVTHRADGSIRRQSQEADNLASAMHQMVATSQEVARHAEETSAATNEADNLTNSSHQVVESIVANVRELAQEIDAISATITRVADASTNIDKVLEVIRGIAEQTNLLALNAAIEAARAGEAGRGFAVVADEVRTLAQRTQDSTAEIRGIMESLQSGSKEAATAMQRGVEQAKQTAESSTKAEGALQAMADAIARIRDMSAQIATAAEEQSSTAESVNISVSTINDASSQVADTSSQTAQAADSVADAVQQLERLVNRFKV